MGLASDADNIRYYGTGRAYAGEVNENHFDDLGELENINFALTVTTEKLYSTRNAARATLIEKETERDATLTFGLREMTNENLNMTLLGSAINTDNQSAGYIDHDNPSFEDDRYIALDKLNVFITKLTGTITGTLEVGDTATGDSSSATGKIAFVGANYIEIINLSGTFTVGEDAEETADTNYISISGIETLEDVVVTDSTGATRRVQGTDYNLDPDYGYLRKLSAGAIEAADIVSADYEAVNVSYIWGMSAGSVERNLIFVSDKDDNGVRQRWTFHKVNILLNGEFPLIGEGASVLAVTGTVLKDTSQPSGQEYYKVETLA